MAAAVAALCVWVPLIGGSDPSSRGPATAAGRPTRLHPTASPSAAAPGPTVLSIGSGTLDGIGWSAQVSVDEKDVCQHLTIGGAQVDAPAGFWTDCVPTREDQPDGAAGVHIAKGSDLRLLTAFGSDSVAGVVVTFTDGTTRQGVAVRLPRTATEATVVPIAPGQRISAVDVYDTRGARVGRLLGYA